MTAGAADGGATWCRRAPDDCVWADCADGVVVYHRPSGKTHLMNDAGVALLTDVLVEPRTLEQIVSVFEPPPGHESDEVKREMRSLLGHLERFGLVERV